MKNQMDIGDSFVKSINRLSVDSDITQKIKVQNVINFDRKLWKSVVDELTEFIIPWCSESSVGVQQHVLPRTQINSNLYYYGKVDNFNMDVVKVNYKHMYASRFVKAFVDEGYRTLPFLETLYPLLYNLISPHNTNELTDDSKHIIRYVLNCYYRVHDALATQYMFDRSPIEILFDAFGELKTKPLVYLNVDTMCFNPNKLGCTSKNIVSEINSRLAVIDNVLYMPRKTIMTSTTIDNEIYEKTISMSDYFSK